MTDPKLIPQKTKKRLGLIIGKYINVGAGLKPAPTGKRGRKKR
jgi:hypothetical protein